MVRWFEVIAMAHLHPYYAEGSMERHALPALTSSDSKMLAHGHCPLAEQTPEWHWFLSLHLFVIILTSLYFTTNLRSWFCKEFQLFRRLGLYMTKQPPVKRPCCYAWQSSPADVEGEGWQGSTLQSTLALSFTMPFLPCWLCLRSYLVFGRYFMLATGEKEIMCGKKNDSHLRILWAKNLENWVIFLPLFFFFFPFLLVFSSSFLFLFIVPLLFPLFCPHLLFFKDRGNRSQVSITCSVFYIHKGVVHYIIFKCTLINTRNI